jgi:hypothetical protein
MLGDVLDPQYMFGTGDSPRILQTPVITPKPREKIRARPIRRRSFSRSQQTF